MMTSYLIAGPGEEPVSLAEARAFARIDGSDEDALVSALIAAALVGVNRMTLRELLIKSLVSILIGTGLVSFVASAQAGQLIKAGLSFDGSFNTTYRAGDKPQGGGDTVVTGYTGGALGTTTSCTLTATDADTQQFAALTAGDFLIMRQPKRRSCWRWTNQFQRLSARHSSFTCSTPPNSLRARLSASSRLMPSASKVSASVSMW